RPENAFILFRAERCKTLGLDNGGKKLRQVELNKIISQEWRVLSDRERASWEARAKDKKKEHQTLYPNYKYCP
ncbi:high mobility group box domain-containing protein, partial [Mycena pura]